MNEFMIKKFEAWLCCCAGLEPSEEESVARFEACQHGFYRSEDEAVAKIKLLQDDPELAQRIAMKGQEFAQSRYSFARVGQALATEIQREMRPWQPPSAFTQFWVKLRHGMKVPT